MPFDLPMTDSGLVFSTMQLLGGQKVHDCEVSQCFIWQLLEEDTPGKLGGQPGDAFELVYTSVTDTVRERMHAVDPVLAEYIRYG